MGCLQPVRSWPAFRSAKRLKLGGFLPVGFWVADPVKLTFDVASWRDSYAPKLGHSINRLVFPKADRQLFRSPKAGDG